MKRVLFFASIMFLTNAIYGQYYFRNYSEEQRKEMTHELFKKSSFVIEGVVQDFKPFYSPDEIVSPPNKKKIYTSIEVTVKKIWKGGLDNNTKKISLIIPEGVIKSDDQRNNHSSVNFNKGSNYVFLLKKSNLRHPDNLYKEAFKLIEYKHLTYAQNYLKSFQIDEWVGFYDLFFSSSESFYSFLQEALKK
jgi:hypothetical protein